MNRELLLKLKKNPHYKFTKEQQAEIDAIEREMNNNIIQFGKPNYNQNRIPYNSKGLQRFKK